MRRCIKSSYSHIVLVVSATLLTSTNQAVAHCEPVKLTASDAASGDQFGRFVAIDGDFLVVGTPLDDDDANDAGAVSVDSGLVDRLLRYLRGEHLFRCVVCSGEAVEDRRRNPG